MLDQMDDFIMRQMWEIFTHVFGEHSTVGSQAHLLYVL